jgi:hypothetical protein
MPGEMPGGCLKSIIKPNLKKSCSRLVFTVTCFKLGCSSCRISDLFGLHVGETKHQGTNHVLAYFFGASIFTREYTQCTAGYTFCFVVGVGVGVVRATFSQTWQYFSQQLMKHDWT